MNHRWMLLPTFTLLMLTARLAGAAAAVAIMPVRPVNLTAGQADAIGVLFGNAFAREANVPVASPSETKPLLAQGSPPSAVAAKLGVFEYVEVEAVQLGSKTTLLAVRRAPDGREVARAEAVSASLDDMQAAVAQLARSLVWTPAGAPPPSPPWVVTDSPPVALPPPAPAGPRPYPAALGVKSGIIFPMASGRSFASLMSLQFDARIGPRGSFAELGAGFAIPSTTASGSGDVEMGGVYAELGGGVFLSSGSIAPYLAGGVSPRIWIISAPNGHETSGATCTVHGQAGVNFTRDSRARVYGELRVSQYVIGLTHQIDTIDGAQDTDAYYPTELSLHVGIGW